MGKQDLTEIMFILDRSGSMNSVRQDAIGGFNSFIEKQRKQPGEAKVTVALFDDYYEVVQDGVDLKDVKLLDETTYVPRGMTALYDAVGRTFNVVGARLASTAEEDRPSKVIAVVITDGAENASKEFRGTKVKEMIAHQREKYGWEVIFIGADESSMSGASNMGLGMTRGAGGQSVSASYSMGTVNGANLSSAYATMSTAVSNFRSKGTVGDWTNGEDLTQKT